jgi:Fe-S-cluster-containing dehydrogenase component
VSRLGMSVDLERCVGCWACAVACKTEHDSPEGVWLMSVEVLGHGLVDRSLGATPEVAKSYRPRACVQCADAPCLTVCPTDALVVRPDGIVEVDDDACIGCGKCESACPYDAIAMQPRPGDPSRSVAAKCDFCAHRVDAGLLPACADACPTDAIVFGPVDSLPREGAEQLHPELGTDPSVWFAPNHRAERQRRSVAVPPTD